MNYWHIAVIIEAIGVTEHRIHWEHIYTKWFIKHVAQENMYIRITWGAH